MSEHLLDGVLVRGAVYCALALSTGPVLWAWLVERERLAFARWRVIAIVVLLAFAAVLGVVQATLAFAEEWSFAAAGDVLRHTAYGRVLAVHLALSVVHALVVALRRPALTVASGLAATVAVALLGHAAVQARVHAAVHVVHAAAAIAWLGGLAILIERIARRTLRLAHVRRFSVLALPLVGVLVATGLARTASFVLRGEPELGWLGVLVVKLAFFAGALAIAYGHRHSGFHGLALAETDAGWRRFQTRLILELWFVACALLLAALLSQLPPP